MVLTIKTLEFMNKNKNINIEYLDLKFKPKELKM